MWSSQSLALLESSLGDHRRGSPPGRAPTEEYARELRSHIRWGGHREYSTSVAEDVAESAGGLPGPGTPLHQKDGEPELG